MVWGASPPTSRPGRPGSVTAILRAAPRRHHSPPASLATCSPAGRAPSVRGPTRHFLSRTPSLVRITLPTPVTVSCPGKGFLLPSTKVIPPMLWLFRVLFICLFFYEKKPSRILLYHTTDDVLAPSACYCNHLLLLVEGRGTPDGSEGGDGVSLRVRQ